MRKLSVALAVALAGCPTTNTPPDGGTDAFPGDAHVCQQGETCDCRASSLLPAGTHWMGNDFDMGRYASPAHRVTLTRSIYVGTFEATAGCYAACLRDGECGAPEQLSDLGHPVIVDGYWDDPNNADLPILGLTPGNAAAYCTWLGGRLPTNAEWEKLARGEDARGGYWMDAPPDPRRALPPTFETLCAHGSDATGPCNGMAAVWPVAVSAFGAGPYGHFGLLGNAFEYVADGLEPYAGEDAVDPLVSPVGRRATARSDWYTGSWSRRDASALGPAGMGVRCAFDTPPNIFPR